MELNDIKDLVKLFNEIDNKTLFGALVVYETIGHIQDLDELNDGDMEYLESIYYHWLKKDDIVSNGILNAKELIEEYEKERGGM